MVDEGWKSLDQFVKGKVLSCYGTVQVPAIGERKHLVAELSHTHHLRLRVRELKVKQNLKFDFRLPQLNLYTVNLCELTSTV